MKWLLIIMTTGPSGEWAVTATTVSRYECVVTGEGLLVDMQKTLAPGDSMSYKCFPTAPEQVAYLGIGHSS